MSATLRLPPLAALLLQPRRDALSALQAAGYSVSVVDDGPVSGS